MRAGIASIRKELAGLYSKEETESLIFLIFEHLKGYSRTQFLMAQDESLSSDELRRIEHIVSRLKKHEPIQYILGTTEFYGLPFLAVPGALIPRPETEELVQWIIQENTVTAPEILDIGTGTGCIAISLRKNIQQANVTAIDISPVCLETAQLNARLNACEVWVTEFDILTGNPATNFPAFDVIVSNPPYIRESEKTLMEKNVLDFEPELALFVPDNDPLIFYSRIAEFAKRKLKQGGKLYFEINEAFGHECASMLQAKGFSGIEIRKDIHGKDRFVAAVF
jgi:release factor glutamine methyltransferase